jgi:hypothetical protein
MSRRNVILLTLSLSLVCGPSALFATEDGKCGVCDLAQSREWGASAPGKLLRGVANVGLSWTNLFAQPIREESIMGGMAKGVGVMMTRLFQGAGEILLSWIPPATEEPLHECVFGDMGITGR